MCAFCSSDSTALDTIGAVLACHWKVPAAGCQHHKTPSWRGFSADVDVEWQWNDTWRCCCRPIQC